MKLKEEQRKYLAGNGYSPYAITQIEQALKRKNTQYMILPGNATHCCGKIISRERALELLGLESFLSGIARSAFHWTAARTTEDGRMTILFDSSNLFRG